MQGQTETDSLIKVVLRQPRRVHVQDFLGLHEASFVVDRGQNDTVSDSLGHNVLRGLLRIEVQLDADVFQRDLRVGQGDHPDTGLDDISVQARHQGEVVVLDESALVLLQHFSKCLSITQAHSLGDEEVWSERATGTLEDLELRDVTHQQFNDDVQLSGLSDKAFGQVRLWSLSQSCSDTLVCGCVVQLDGIDSGQVVEVSGSQSTTGVGWEGDLFAQVRCLADVVGEEVVSQQQGDYGCRGFLVVLQRGTPQSVSEKRAHRQEVATQFVSSGDVEPDLCADEVKSALVERVDHADDVSVERIQLVQFSLVQQVDSHEQVDVGIDFGQRAVEALARRGFRGSFSGWGVGLGKLAQQNLSGAVVGREMLADDS